MSVCVCIAGCQIKKGGDRSSTSSSFFHFWPAGVCFLFFFVQWTAAAAGDPSVVVLVGIVVAIRPEIFGTVSGTIKKETNEPSVGG